MRVVDFHIGTQILDTAVVQHIAANLVPPTHITFAGFELLLRLHAFAHFKVVQARAQALPSHISVTVLAAAVLALHHDACGDMCQAHGRIGFVDVLAACAAGAVGVGAHVGRVDVDFDRIVNFRVNKNAGKAGVASARRIKRRFAHQAVHPGFGAQQAVGIFAIDFETGALDACHIAGGFFLYFNLEALALAVTHILA